MISFFILRIAETEKLSFLFYVRVVFLMFVNICMFFDNLRLIFTNGNIVENLKSSLWPKQGHFSEGLSDYISMLAYVYEMADCYLASKFTSFERWLIRFSEANEQKNCGLFSCHKSSEPADHGFLLLDAGIFHPSKKPP